MSVDARCGRPGRGTGGRLANVLTETQARFLNAFFSPEETGTNVVYLSGGTALAGYYLHHRQSDDLDFFTREAEALRFADPRMERAARSAGLEIQRVERWDMMVRYHLTGDRLAQHSLVKCEAVWDSPPYFAPPRRFGDVWVDDLLCIAVNKVTALSRREPKDYVDLYLIVRSGTHRLEDLLPLARSKDPGLDELVLAGDFQAVGKLGDIARFQQDYLLIPLDWREVEQFYMEWASRLFALYPPRAER